MKRTSAADREENTPHPPAIQHLEMRTLAPPTAKRLSLSLRKNNPKRFGPFFTEEEQATAAKGVVPANTKVFTKDRCAMAVK